MALKEDIIVEQLFRNRVRLMPYIRSIVADFHATEDIYQNISMLAIRSAEKFNDSHHLVKWLWVVCHTESLSYLKSHKSSRIVLDNTIIEAIEEEFQKNSYLDTQDVYTSLARCLTKLTENARRILNLRYEKNLTGDQIAEVLNLKRASVFVSICRIHRMLRNCMKQHI